jgi:hypothetical protein
VRYAGLKERYRQRQLVPFARRVDCDDVACFETTAGVKPLAVQVIHDFAAPGWEQRKVFDNFDTWLAAAESEEV